MDRNGWGSKSATQKHRSGVGFETGYESGVAHRRLRNHLTKAGRKLDGLAVVKVPLPVGCVKYKALDIVYAL